MANHTIDKFKYGSDTFVLQDNVSGYITSAEETDPVFSASPAHGITSADITNWDSKTSNTGTVTSVGITNDTNGGLSVSGSPVTESGSITVGHSNVLTNAQTTSGVYPIKIDKNGHISEYGSAVTIPSITLNGSSTTSPNFYAPTTAGTNGYVLTSRGSGAPTWQNIGFSNVTTDSATITLAGVGYSFSRKDTKNTAGSTATSSKIYLVGATSQDTYVQTYSNSSLYYNNGLASFAQSGQNGSSILQIVQKVSLTATTSSNSSTIDVGSTGIDITYEDSQGNIAQGIYLDGLVTPTNDYQAATKAYVDNSVPLNTSNETTGITVSNHSTGSVTGVQSTTTTASKVTLGTAFSVPNVTAVGSGSASLTFEIDSTDSNQLNIGFSHTHTAPTLGTAFSIPNVTGNSNVTVPIKDTSATTVVTSATHTVNDSGHYHDVGRYL